MGAHRSGLDGEMPCVLAFMAVIPVGAYASQNDDGPSDGGGSAVRLLPHRAGHWRSDPLCSRNRSGPRNCRNNAVIRARELKPSLPGCACLAAVQSGRREEEGRAPSRAIRHPGARRWRHQVGWHGMWQAWGGPPSRMSSLLTRRALRDGWRSVLAVGLAAELGSGVGQRSWIAGFDHGWLVGSKTTH